LIISSTINYDKQKGDKNNRWKRNPRAGVYSFLLVVTTEEELTKIPYFYRDITLTDSVNMDYQNPYYYFLFDTIRNDNSKTILSDSKLKASVKLDLSKGIFINTSKLDQDADLSGIGEYCNYSDHLFTNAHLEQYFDIVDKNYSLENIPIAYDVVGDNYSTAQYNDNASKFKENQLVKDHVKISGAPGQTVGYDSIDKAVFIKNPGSSTTSGLIKENVGIKTRYGFTYGKYRAKIKFPNILNYENVWNGITCAFWLKYQEGDWNKRSNCRTGYAPKLFSDQQTISESVYSEIDIEIVKTSKFWPETSYINKEDYQIDSSINNNVILTCTNWDLACHDPDSFNIGVRKFQYKKHEFYLHRWDDSYKALSSKFELPQNESLGKAIYYEIEWQPTFIIWRIGFTKDDMLVIGYMDESCTMIPDNQMEMVISQEPWPDGTSQYVPSISPDGISSQLV
jgi:hypothetical protein